MKHCVFLLVMIFALRGSHGLFQEYGHVQEMQNLFLFEGMLEISYSFDFEDLEHTDNNLLKCVDELTNICKLCNFECNEFVVKAKSFHVHLKENTKRYKHLMQEIENNNKGRTQIQRKKRVVSLVVAMGVMATVQIISTFFTANSAIKVSELRKELDSLTDLTERMYNKSVSSGKNGSLKDHIIENKKTIDSVIDRVNSLNETMTIYQQFNNIKFTIADLINERCNIIDKKLKSLLSGDLRSYFLDVIDFKILKEHIKNETQKLELIDQTLLIQELNINFLEHFVTREIEVNAMRISLNFYVPLMKKANYRIYEFKPLPVLTFENKPIILQCDHRILYVRKNDEIFELMPMIYDSDEHCKKNSEMVICKLSEVSVFKEKKSLCLQNVILHNSQHYCVFIPAKQKNTVIYLNETALYCFIVEPITITIRCAKKEDVQKIELTKSKVIPIEENCLLYSDVIMEVNSLKYRTWKNSGYKSDVIVKFENKESVVSMNSAGDIIPKFRNSNSKALVYTPLDVFEKFDTDEENGDYLRDGWAAHRQLREDNKNSAKGFFRNFMDESEEMFKNTVSWFVNVFNNIYGLLIGIMIMLCIACFYKLWKCCTCCFNCCKKKEQVEK